MHNPFFENANNLRREWKELRQGFTPDKDDAQHLSEVARWWSRAPIAHDWLNWDDPSTWPDPWELITTGRLDNSAIALGMEYTLLLGNDGRWTPDRVKLWLASDTKKTMQHLVVAVDGRWILNVEHAKVVEMDDDLTVHAEYRYDGKKHIEL